MSSASDRLLSLAQQLESSPRLPFADFAPASIPVAAAGVYAVWPLSGNLLYVGMAGRGKSFEQIAEARRRRKVLGLRQRLSSHAGGRRSGDQFCVYVADRLVLPSLDTHQIEDIGEGRLSFDQLVKNEISGLQFAWVECADGAEALALEVYLFREWKPAWNAAG